MNVQTFVSFRDELLKIAAVIPMVSHYEVTLDEDGKATGLSDTTQQLAYLPIGLKTMRSKIDEDLEKTSGWGDVATHAAEVGGLGILARPTVHKMQGKTVSKRSEHAHELVGLGVLAAPSAAHLGHMAYKGIKGLAKKASVEKDGSAGVNTFINETFKKGAHGVTEAARKARIQALTSRPAAGLRKLSSANLAGGALSLFSKKAGITSVMTSRGLQESRGIAQTAGDWFKHHPPAGAAKAVAPASKKLTGLAKIQALRN